ncbi:glycosyltransferase [Amycolatopsis sp. NPDC051716]|uniref:glycosyltransferase n=1 Tax=Amycolatopsis sp. NPDC051716 TaxID=3155804 RepID=UPI00343E26A6
MLAISCGVDRAHYAGPSHELLEATVALPPEVRVELVGDGSERARLEAPAARLGIAERVTFHGFVPDEELVRAYRRYAVFCMPGTAELRSLATMAAGKPVVADEPARRAMGQTSLELIAAHDLDSTVDTFEGVYLDVARRPAPVALPR